MTDRVAIVTGAARGIGFAIARALCETGMRVALNDREEEAVRSASAELAASGYRVMAAAGDIASAAAVATMFDRVEAELGPLWLLVNNAGIFRGGSGAEAKEEDWDATFAVDVKGVFLCSQAAMKRMMPRQAGRIIVISSIAGLIVRTNQIAYCAAKAAAVHFARCLAVEAAPHRITVNCICPGMTDSPMLRETAAGRGIRVDDYLTMVPAGRLAEADDHAHPVCWLASDAAQHVTGQVISVDGGQSLYHPVIRNG